MSLVALLFPLLAMPLLLVLAPPGSDLPGPDPRTWPWCFHGMAVGGSIATVAGAIHAPLPRHAIGRASAVGDVKSMVFDQGVITVRVSAVEPGRRLVAEVIEQTIERRALLLSTVTVTCEPIGPERTRMMLRLDFVPCMGPRWYWRPFERWFGGIAFDAVFDAWEREVCEPVATPGG